MSHRIILTINRMSTESSRLILIHCMLSTLLQEFNIIFPLLAVNKRTTWVIVLIPSQVLVPMELSFITGTHQALVNIYSLSEQRLAEKINDVLQICL